MTSIGRFERQSGRAARALLVGAILLAPAAWASTAARADEGHGFLETIKKHTTLTSTVPDNGDLNPYALFVAPVSAGKIQKDDLLIDNFNNSTNLQGLGTTIVIYRPSTKEMLPFAQLPRHIDGCPGGVGLSTAMAVLKSGWVIVGSTPSEDGTTGTKGAGCLIVLDSNGKLAGTLTGPNINDPWGNMALIDKGASATLFVSNAGFDIGTAEGEPPVVRKATVARIELAIAEGKPPTVSAETVIGDGFGAQADKGVFLVGPTGLTLAKDGTTLYVSDAIDNRVVAIADATTRATSAGQGREITKDGFLKRPLAMVTAPNGNLLVTNALNGQVVEINPLTGKQLYARWIDTDRAQTPPGSGDLFGIAMTPEGDGFYYVEDDMNTVVLAR
jgi:hypothetical protein